MNVFQRFDVGLRAWFYSWFVDGAADEIAPAVKNAQHPQRRLTAEGTTTTATPVAKTPAPAPTPKPKPTPPAPPAKPVRSDALTLLETLQREARLLDFLKEDLSQYDDAQIGAAVRDVHRDSARVLDRLFNLQPALLQDEGSAVDLQSVSPGQTRLVGNVREGVTTGTLVHSGWKVEKVDMPSWSGTQEIERIVAPAEIEV